MGDDLFAPCRLPGACILRAPRVCRRTIRDEREITANGFGNIDSLGSRANNWQPVDTLDDSVAGLPWGMTRTDAFDRVEVRSADQLREWLLTHHNQPDSVWLVTYKKHVADAYVSVSEVLDELMCFGWIDGIRRKLDDDRTMQLIAPRSVQHWSKTYKDRVARLTDAGRMHASGLATVERGKASGLWSFLDDVDALIVPEDLQAALDDTPTATAYYESCPPSYRRNLLRHIKLAKTALTRARRIAKVAAACGEKRRIPQM